MDVELMKLFPVASWCWINKKSLVSRQNLDWWIYWLSQAEAGICKMSLC